MKRSALFGLASALSLMAALCQSYATPDRTSGAWAERVQIIYLSQSRSVVSKGREGLGPAPGKEARFRLGAGHRHRSGHRRRRHDQRQGQAGLARARLGELRSARPSTASMPARCATAARTATAGSSSVPARFSTATGRMAASKARASMSMPTAIATRACSLAGIANGEGRLLARYRRDIRRRVSRWPEARHGQDQACRRHDL